MLRFGLRTGVQFGYKNGVCRHLVASRCRSNSSSQIFDRKAKALQKERAARDPDVKLYDYLKEEMGNRMVDRLYDLKIEIKNAAEIGCTRGFISRHDLADIIEHLQLCESNATLLDQAQVADGLKVTKVNMDEETLELPENSLDLVLSSLSLHWVNDLPGCFKRIHKGLKPNGAFMGVMFGNDTLYELRTSLQLAELERKSGISPHTSPFVRSQDVGSLLQQCGFNMLTVTCDEMQIGYPNMFELMYDLKGMGENNAAFNRPLHLSRDVMLAASAIYDEMYKIENGVRATFEFVHFIGWKPGPNQPQPLERGSATVSFKDLAKLNKETKT